MPILQGLLNAARPRFLSREARAKRHLKRSMVPYDNIYESYWAKIRRNRDVTQHKDWIDRIDADGFCIVPDYLDAATLAAAQAEMQALPGFAVGRYDGPIRHRLPANGGILAPGFAALGDDVQHFHDTIHLSPAGDDEVARIYCDYIVEHCLDLPAAG
jgi:hypothetical protein